MEREDIKSRRQTLGVNLKVLRKKKRDGKPDLGVHPISLIPIFSKIYKRFLAN